MHLRCLILTLLFSTSLHADGRTQCLDQLQADVGRWNKQMHQQYERISRDHHPDNPYADLRKIVRDAEGIKRGNHSVLLKGTNDKAILVQHGFMASPFEVMSVARRLNSDGYTVLAPLLDGFGSNYAVANAKQISHWRASFERSVKALAACYESIALIGFSLGGALASDFVLNTTHVNQQGRLNDGGRNKASISEVVLLSPYFGVPVWGAKASIGGVILVDKNDSIQISAIPHPDLAIPERFPQHYNVRMPLVSVSEILSLSQEFKQLTTTTNIPTFLVVSDADKTIDLDAAMEVLAERFNSDRDVLKVYEKSCDIPHQLATKEGNKHLDNMLANVNDFLTGNKSGMENHVVLCEDV